MNSGLPIMISESGNRRVNEFHRGKRPQGTRDGKGAERSLRSRWGRNMNVLIYGKSIEPAKEHLKNLIQENAPWGRIEDYPTIESLSRGLRQPREGRGVAILFAADRDEIRELISIHPLLHDTPIILILPDREPETISMAHQLRPRFLSDIRGDWASVIEVFKRMAATGPQNGG